MFEVFYFVVVIVCWGVIASNLCFQEKSVFTQEVLAVVIQQLLEQDPIPVLFMRTVSQPHCEILYM